MQSVFPSFGVRSEWLPMDGQCYTIEEYLAFERGEPEKHMFLDGKTFEFHGEDWSHGGISVNVVVSIGSQLHATPFHARTKRTCIYSGPIPPNRDKMSGMFTYPDLVVVEQADYFDESRDVIVNPKVIIEIRSESTEAFDRGEKFNGSGITIRR